MGQVEITTKHSHSFVGYEMNLLVYYGEPNQYWLVDTPSRLDGAKRYLFEFLDSKGCYTDLAFEFYELLKSARAGNIRSISSILKMRNGCPGQKWSLQTAYAREDTSERYKPNYLTKIIRSFLRP